jgi:threonine/homoserine/homoserine lactone efflux protein
LAVTFHVWLGFAAASAALAVLPGPGVMSILGYAIGSGRRVALASVAGLAVGNFAAMSLSLAGVGVLLAASAAAFTIIKAVGAVYLVVLGIRTLLEARRLRSGGSFPAPARDMRSAFIGNVAVGTFNPKTIVFFVAFVPQFIEPQASYPAQAALLVATFVVVLAVTDISYAIAAARASQILRRPRTLMWAKGFGGGVLVASGLVTAAVRQ